MQDFADIRLGDFEQLLLFAVFRLGDRAYGTSIRREVERCAGRSPSAGAVYTSLERLEEKGFVASWFGEPTPERGGKRKKFYQLKPAGARVLTHSYEATRQMAKGLLPRLHTLANSRSK